MKAILIDRQCIFCGEKRLFTASVIQGGKTYYVCIPCTEEFKVNLDKLFARAKKRVKDGEN